MAEYGYNYLEENSEKVTTRPGSVYVTTGVPTSSSKSKSATASKCTSSITEGTIKEEGSTTDVDDKKQSSVQASVQASFDANPEDLEPQCEIIVHTAQMGPPRPQYASDHFSISLFVAICCFLPFGVVGLIKNHQSRLKAVAGDYDGALAASRIAHKFAIAGCIIGTLCYTGFAAFSMAVLIMTLTGDT